MTKAKMAILKQAFEEEIGGGILQRKNKTILQLVDEGCLHPVSRSDGSGWLRVTFEGYELTHKGRLLFCESCSDASDVL
jgi:hypothetical protein